MTARRFGALLLLAGAAALGGCGGGPPVAEVTGTVRSNGQPLEKIQVEFWPLQDGPKSVGVTDAQGRYALLIDGSRPGAVVGRHKVILRDVGVLGDTFLGRAGESVDMTKGRKPRVGAAYTDPQRTPVEKAVTAGKNDIDIDVAP
ncbi:MAG TPA: hypothetical protein VM597_10525 [Gemmataceae bacterium]|nr:hypothetical protein [Gemmataceae bacterium]